MELDNAATRPHRGRIVMLVDNDVTSDSRVQKAARSAADAGWEVTLLGCSTSGDERTWNLGGAAVRLVRLSTGTTGSTGTSGTGATGTAGQAGAGSRGTLRRVKDRLAAMETRGSRIASVARGLRTGWDHLSVWFWCGVEKDRAWRRLEPGLWKYERAFGPVIDELAPDLIHANDFRMLGVGARATTRARTAGRDVSLVWDAHEFLPGIKPWRDNPRWLPAHRGYEREYAPYADAVVTVSAALADLLRAEHNLATTPTVVLNAPAIDSSQRPDTGTHPAAGPHTDTGPHTEGGPGPDLRALCGVGTEVPLLVYAGVAAVQRGLGIIVAALPQLPGAHAALVVNRPDSPYVRQLIERAHTLGVADRLHVLPYVSPWHVVAFLSSADIGVIPIHHWPNHEIALITKFFEYSHARLPIVVSDVRTMADTVRSTGQGEVFRAEDLDDFVRAARLVLADPPRYRAAYQAPGLLDGWTWQAQAEILDTVYTRLRGASVVR